MRHLYKRIRLLRSLRTKMLLAGALLLASSADGQTIRSFRQENRSLICHTDSGTLCPAARCRADDGTTASAGNRREGAGGHTEHVAASHRPPDVGRCPADADAASASGQLRRHADGTPRPPHPARQGATARHPSGDLRRTCCDDKLVKQTHGRKGPPHPLRPRFLFHTLLRGSADAPPADIPRLLPSPLPGYAVSFVPQFLLEVDTPYPLTID